mgnify:FL=1
MIYAYIRVSTDKQSVENQRYEIETFCRKKNFAAERWIEETISSRVSLQERKLGKLLKRIKHGDTLIVSELSRLGRSLMEIMGILNTLMRVEAKLITVKENYELGDNINSKVLAFAFGLSAEVERTLISARTREALARKKAEGIKLGRPKGKNNNTLKLTPQKEYISEMLRENMAVGAIAKRLQVHRSTLTRFLKRKSMS